MCAAASVVKGEAVESDLSDEENIFENVKLQEKVKAESSNSPHGASISGEAPESDEEQTPSVASSVNTHFVKDIPQTPTKSFDTLLHKKLTECNLSLYSNIQSFIKNTVNSTQIQLSMIDQQLLKSQLRLQQARTSLKNLESTSCLLANRLSIAACSSYIPQIRIPLPESDSE